MQSGPSEKDRNRGIRAMQEDPASDGGLKISPKEEGAMIPMVKVCELFQGVGAFRADEVLTLAGSHVPKANCMVRAFALIGDDQGAASRSLVADFTVVVATSPPEPEDRYKGKVSCTCQGEHIPPYQRVNIPVELVVYRREPEISCGEPIRMPGEGILRPVDVPRGRQLLHLS